LFSIGIPAVTLLLINPFIGLLSVICINHFDFFIFNEQIFTVGRAIGILVAVGWFVKYFYLKRTYFFQSIKFNIVPVIFILAMVMSSILAEYPGRSIDHTITITLLVLMLFFIQDFISDKKTLNILLLTIALSVGITSLVGVMQYKLILAGQEAFGTVSGAEQRIAGFDRNANGYGALMMTGIPLLFYWLINARNVYIKLISLLFCGTALLSLCLTLSRTHIFGFVIFIVVYVLLNFVHKNFSLKSLLSLMVVIVFIAAFFQILLFDIIEERVIGYTFSGADTSSGKRFIMILKGLRLLRENPIFGVGFHNFEMSHVSDYPTLLMAHGHDLISVLFASTGAVGIMIFITICYKTMRNFNLAIKHFAMVGKKELFNLGIILQAAFIALLMTFAANAIIHQRILWVYIALSVVLYRWSTLDPEPETDPDSTN
jgi:O-antigen ligase